MRMVRGLPEAYRTAAAALYWQAFGGKLGRVLGPDRLALAYVERVIRPDQCICAMGDGGLTGLVGFKSDAGSFAGGTPDDMRQVYGRLGGAWRSGVMQLAGGEGETGLFLIDGLCVQPQARGRGVGSALIEAICTEAAARGFNTVRLDVVDTNPRARSLYERRGFVLDHSTPVGPLGLVFGYSVTHTMVRYL